MHAMINGRAHRPTTTNLDNLGDSRTEGRKKLVASTRPYRTILSDFARLFQRAALKANQQEQAEIMAILAEARHKLEDLLDKIDAKPNK